MAEYTEVLATDFSFPHIDIYRQYTDGVQNGYKALAQDGYVFYDTTATDTEFDPETMEERPVTYYYTIRLFPMRYNMDDFSLVAVPRESVDENYIFGGEDNDHEIM